MLPSYHLTPGWHRLTPFASSSVSIERVRCSGGKISFVEDCRRDFWCHHCASLAFWHSSWNFANRYTWNLLTSWYFMPLHSNISKANSWRTFTFFKEVEWLSYEEIFSFTTPFSPQVWVTFLAMTLGTGSPIARIVMSECRSGGATEFKWIWWDRTQRRYITWFGDIWWTARIKEGRCCEGALPSCIVRRRID